MQYFSFIGSIIHKSLHTGGGFSEFFNKAKSSVGLDWNTDEMFISSFFQKNPQLLNHSPSSKLLGQNGERRVEPWQIKNFSFSGRDVNNKMDVHFHARNWPELKDQIKKVHFLWRERFNKHDKNNST
jgi:hypothetical protein